MYDLSTSLTYDDRIAPKLPSEQPQQIVKTYEDTCIIELNPILQETLDTSTSRVEDAELFGKSVSQNIHKCEICKVSCNNEYSIQAHFDGKRHRKKAKYMEMEMKEVAEGVGNDQGEYLT